MVFMLICYVGNTLFLSNEGTVVFSVTPDIHDHVMYVIGVGTFVAGVQGVIPDGSTFLHKVQGVEDSTVH